MINITIDGHIVSFDGSEQNVRTVLATLPPAVLPRVIPALRELLKTTEEKYSSDVAKYSGETQSLPSNTSDAQREAMADYYDNEVTASARARDAACDKITSLITTVTRVIAE